MLKEQKLDVLVVTTVDATHDEYIIPALYAGIKVLTEKPMTTYVSWNFFDSTERADMKGCREV